MDDKLKILLIEDEVTLRETISFMLLSSGYKTFEAGTVAEALEKAALHLPDIILLDWYLPVSNGDVFLRRAVRDYRIPVIVMSCNGGQEFQAEVLAMGAVDILTKPVELNHLLARLRHVEEYHLGKEKIRIFRSGFVEIDFENLQARVKGSEITFSLLEFSIVGILAKHAGKYLEKEFILKKIHESGLNCQQETLTTDISRIRKKLRTGGSPEIIRTASRKKYGLIILPKE